MQCPFSYRRVKILNIIFDKGTLTFFSYSSNHLIRSFVLRHWLIFNASLSKSHISWTIILLTLPICVLAGLISLHSGLVLKSLLWSLIVMKQFLVLYFSTLSTIPSLCTNIFASLFNSFSRSSGAFL